MPKSACRLYPVDIELKPWESLDSGISVRILTADGANGAFTRLVRLDAARVWARGASAYWSEMYVVSGALRFGGTVLAHGSYLSAAPDEPTPELQALLDTVVLEVTDAAAPNMDKESVTRTAQQVAELPSVRPDGSPEGVTHQVLSKGAKGSVTRLLKVLPFVSTGVFEHDHSEEVMILEGGYKMGSEFHPAGTYTCKGPGVPHGPFLTATGYLGLEFRNYSSPS